MEYESEPRAYEEDTRAYPDERDRSRSPQRERRGDEEDRNRSASPDGRTRSDNRGPPPDSNRNRDDDNAANPGSNLFVTGIHPSLSEEEVTRLFQKYGEVEKCNIMRDPHTRESRGFGFVKMVTSEEADAAKEGLQGEVHRGRTLSIEKARRARPRTPTPGKYFGPPKRDDVRPRGRYGDRYGERRGGYDRRDDYGHRGGRYGDRDDYRSYGRRDRDDYGGRGVDRYASRDDRYGGSYGSRDDRRGYGGGYGREDRAAGGYDDAPPKAEREPYGAGRPAYDDRGDYDSFRQ